MKIKKLSVAVSAALVLAYLPVHADDEGLGGGPEVKLRGFGTFGVVRNTNSKLDFMDNLSQPRGAGYSHKWDFGVDSKLAVQADAKFNEKLSASWQVMTQRQYDDSYRPQTEMAFLKLQPTGDFNVRLGRVPAGLFMVSEYRKVGYVNPWVRQPNEVYFQLPFNSSDGIDGTYQFSSGDFTGNVQAQYGTMRKAMVTNEGDTNTLKGDNGMSFNFIGEYGPVSFRLGYSRVKVTYTGESLARLYDGLKNLSSNGNNISTGMPATIYNTVYGSAYSKVLANPTIAAGLASVQANLPNMEQSSVVDYVRFGTHTDPSLLALQAGINGAIATQVVPAATTARNTYLGAVATGAPTLQDASLRASADSLYDGYAANKSVGSFLGAGVVYDPGTWLIQGEITKRKVENFIADSHGWYLTGGYRFGKVMPFVSLSELKVDSATEAAGLINSGGQNALVAAGAACMTNPSWGATPASSRSPVCFAPFGVVNSLSTGVDKTVKATSYGQKNISLGVRWDAFKNAAIKFQYDRIKSDEYPRSNAQNYVHTVTGATDGTNGSTVLLGTSNDYKDPTDPTSVLTGGTVPGKTYVTEVDKAQPYNVFSLAIDFVF